MDVFARNLRRANFIERSFNMIKKFVMAVPMTFLALSSSGAFAEEARSSINISAQIPTAVFHAQPVDPNFGQDEKMHYSLASGTLNDVVGAYDIRHTLGSVHAYVEGGPQPLFNGDVTKNITLTYAFNGTTLTATPQEVVNAADAAGGVRADLRVSAAKPTPAQTGSYSARPVVVFDAVPSVP
jgi:hypothetical protein